MSHWMAMRRRALMAACGAVDVAALAIAYTGNMTDEIVTMGDGNQYRLLTLTSSGTLTIEKEVTADVWLCGGGANGGGASTYHDDNSGGGGGFVASSVGQKIQTETAIVGAAAGASSFGRVTANGGNGKNGGSGGGEKAFSTTDASGTGAGVTTYPFEDTIYFSGKPHCAGGGGGDYIYNSTQHRGGAGGTNGSNGSRRKTNSYGGGVGGTLGGGTGAEVFSSTPLNGGNATFYGSGGGGASIYRDDMSTVSGGSGYQGVIYVRIPLNQAA